MTVDIAKASKVAAQVAIQSKASVQLAISFGRNASQISHTFRHIDKLGLPRAAVQEAIQNHLPSVAANVSTKVPLNSIIKVNGAEIQYTAFKLSDGTINIGRIHGVP